MTYSEKLKDPRWQKKRLEILQRDNWKCINCFDNTSTLNVHHMNYVSGRNPWEYDNTNFVTLCNECHKMYHHVTNLVDNDEFIQATATIIKYANQLFINDLFNEEEEL